MTSRFGNAIAANQGACNPSGIAIAIVEACKEIRETPGHTGTKQITSDPAIRLMVHQLAYICGLDTRLECQDYTTLVDACEAGAREESAQLAGAVSY